MRKLFYYKIGQKFITNFVRVFIIKCDSFYKFRRFYYKLWQLVQNATFIANCDSTLSNTPTFTLFGLGGGGAHSFSWKFDLHFACVFIFLKHILASYCIMFFYQITYVQTSTSQCFWRFIFKVGSLHSSRYFQERSCDHFHDAIYGFNLSRYMLNINNGDLNMLRTFKL